MSSKWETSWLTLGGTELLKNNLYTLIRRISSTYHTKAEFSSLSTTPALGHVNDQSDLRFFPNDMIRRPFSSINLFERTLIYAAPIRIQWFLTTARESFQLIQCSPPNQPPNAFSKKWLLLKFDLEAGEGFVSSTGSLFKKPSYKNQLHLLTDMAFE